MRAGADGGGCFPTGRHYPGIAHLLRVSVSGLASEFDAATPLSALPLVSIDTETTGRDPNEDRIVEIACVLWDSGRVSARRDWLVNPGRPIPEDARAVHGISDDDVRDKPTFAEVAEEVLSAMSGRVPVAYNAEFDQRFIHLELDRAGIRRASGPAAVRDGVSWIDPLTWARELQKDEKSRALTAVAERLGIEIQQAHRATDDAEAAVQVLARFFEDARVPDTYGAFVREQKRLERVQAEERQYWQRP